MGMTAVRRAESEIIVTGSAAHPFMRAELTGVRYCAFEEPSDADDDDALRDADILLFVVDITEAPGPERAYAIAARARARGILVAALLVSTGAMVDRSSVLMAMRDAADMVIIVSAPSEARAVVTALR